MPPVSAIVTAVCRKLCAVRRSLLYPASTIAALISLDMLRVVRYSPVFRLLLEVNSGDPGVASVLVDRYARISFSTSVVIVN